MNLLNAIKTTVKEDFSKDTFGTVYLDVRMLDNLKEQAKGAFYNNEEVFHELSEVFKRSKREVLKVKDGFLRIRFFPAKSNGDLAFVRKILPRYGNIEVIGEKFPYPWYLVLDVFTSLSDTFFDIDFKMPLEELKKFFY